MKKIYLVILVIIIITLISLGIWIIYDYFHDGLITSRFFAKSCNIDADCCMGMNNNDTFGVSSCPKCFEGKCKNPKNNEEWIKYCDINKSDNCYVNAAYASLYKSSMKKDYTIVWDKAFNVCEKYTQDKENCKLNVCENLDLADGNMKSAYPEKEDCQKDILSICPDGNIIDNIPCMCDVPAKSPSMTAYTEEWLNDYWNKSGKNNKPIYCCDGIQRDTPCNKCTKNTDCKTSACNNIGPNADYTCVEKCSNGKIAENIPCSCSGSVINTDNINVYRSSYGSDFYCCNQTLSRNSCK